MAETMKGPCVVCGLPVLYTSGKKPIHADCREAEDKQIKLFEEQAQ